MTGKPFRITDEEIIAAVRECWDAGERDALEGGVPPRVVAKRAGMSPSTARSRLSELYQRGAVERCWGIDPENPRDQPRLGYAPVEAIDDGADDIPGDNLRGGRSDD